MVAFFAGPKIWPPSGDIQPTPGQIPYFIVLDIIDALSFGIGAIFLFKAWHVFRDSNALPRRQAFVTFLALTWLIISWWPHDNFHIANGMNAQGLLYIEYGFHVTLIAAALIVAYSLLTILWTHRATL